MQQYKYSLLQPPGSEGAEAPLAPPLPLTQKMVQSCNGAAQVTNGVLWVCAEESKRSGACLKRYFQIDIMFCMWKVETGSTWHPLRCQNH